MALSHELSVSAIVLIRPGSLPKTSSGKVQRALCRTQFLARSLSMVGEAGPETHPDRPAPAAYNPASKEDKHDALSATIAEIWSQVLNRSTVNRQDDFFALSGDSLRGLQMVARLQEVRGIEVVPETLFEHPTLAAFTAFVSSVVPACAHSSPEPIPTVARESTLPLSFSQERFWFFEQLSPGSSINNMRSGLSVT